MIVLTSLHFASLTLFTSAFVDPPSLKRRVFVRGSAIMMGGYNSDVSRGNFFNRETSLKGDFSGPVKKEAKILSLSDPDDKTNSALYNGDLPDGARLLAVGTCLEDFNVEALRAEEPNVIVVSHPLARQPLVQLLDAFPTVDWVHSRSAGIDFITSDGLAAKEDVILTNAKGIFSSTLAEYTMMACSYFAKDLPRLMRQKQSKDWNKYNVLEIRGATLGVCGYGDIGRAAAKLAKAYGMRVLALRRNPKKSAFDPYCDEVYGMEELNKIMSESDYILVAAPLTDETRGMISADALSHAKNDAVLINVGRGAVIDELALIEALKNGRLKGCALDVMSVEPLPKDNPLWELESVLLSPHNMDQTATFMQESTDFFINENLPRYIRGLELFNPVDKAAGY